MALLSLYLIFLYIYFLLINIITIMELILIKNKKNYYQFLSPKNKDYYKRKGIYNN